MAEGEDAVVDILEISWDVGGRGRLCSIDGEMVVVESDRPWAPGSRPEGRLPNGHAIRFKVHRCRRLTEADVTPAKFSIDGRMIDPRRDLVARLKTALESTT